MSGYKLKRLCVARFSLSPVQPARSHLGVDRPEGPHRHASVARGHDALLLLRFVIGRAPAANQGPTAPTQDNLVNRLCKLCVLLL